MKEIFLKFTYDNTGQGKLTLCNDSLTCISCNVDARTGSIRARKGKPKLSFKIHNGIWKIQDKPVIRDNRWRIMLRYASGAPSSSYITNIAGTKRSIELLEEGTELKKNILRILEKQKIIKVYINRPHPEIIEPEPPVVPDIKPKIEPINITEMEVAMPKKERKISLLKIIRKMKLIQNLLDAVIELVKYVRTITVDPKLRGINERIRLNLESIFGKSIDDL